jgi:hypothetical protein
MALSDSRDKLATAEDYLLSAPEGSEARAAAWEHVTWEWHHGGSRRDITAMLRRVALARGAGPGLREELATLEGGAPGGD